MGSAKRFPLRYLNCCSIITLGCPAASPILQVSRSSFTTLDSSTASPILQISKEQFHYTVFLNSNSNSAGLTGAVRQDSSHSSTATPMLQVSKEQFDKILDMCKQGEEQGAKLECGGKRLGDKGYYIEPTVFSNVQDDNIIATDEIFGPVQSILKWKTVEEVMALNII